MKNIFDEVHEVYAYDEKSDKLLLEASSAILRLRPLKQSTTTGHEGGVPFKEEMVKYDREHLQETLFQLLFPGAMVDISLDEDTVTFKRSES